MLKKRIIPKLLMKRSSQDFSKLILVTTLNFTDSFEIGDPISQAKIYQAQTADELIFLDIEAYKDEDDNLLEVIKKASEEIFMPFTVGGGIKSIERIESLIKNGADKVSINSEAVRNPLFLKKAVEKYGSSTIVVSIDYKNMDSSKDYKVFIDGATTETNLDPFIWAKEVERLGAGEILLNSIDNDGTKEGLELYLSKKIISNLNIPVVISGGCGKAEHFSDGFSKTDVSGISAGTFFCFRDQNPIQARAQISNSGISIRDII